MIYGYARVSTATQGRDGNSLEDQVAALEKYGCQKIVKRGVHRQDHGQTAVPEPLGSPSGRGHACGM